MDNELVELCKEVYKRFPEWEADDWLGKSAYSGKYQVVPDKNFIAKVFSDEGDAGSYHDYIPNYTSDYLLGKLPYKIGKANSAIWLRLGKSRNGFAVCYMGSDLVWLYECEDATPLKALLKLTIELHKQGLLEK